MFKSESFKSAFLLFALITLAGCSHVSDGMIRGRSAINDVLDTVEREMDDNAPFADSLVNLIDAHSIHSKEQRARYALLYTAAEYKSYHLLTSDSLIMEAVRYYSISNNLEYRFLSYYYLGCAFVDMKMFSDASVALAQAEQLVNDIDNDYWKGLLYSQLGYVFNESNDFFEAEIFYSKAEFYFSHAGKEIHRLYALLSVGDMKINKLGFKAADSIIHIVSNQAIILNDSLLYNKCIYNRMYCALYMGEIDSASVLYDSFISHDEYPFKSPGFMGLMALYCNFIRDYDKSEFYLESAWESNLSETDTIYLYYVSALLAESKGEIKESLESFQKYIKHENDRTRALLKHHVAGAQRDYYRTLSELEAIKARNRDTVLVASIIIFLLVIFCIFFINLNHKRKVQEKIHDYLSTIDELREREFENHDKIKSLNSQVREMLRQQFTASDYLYTRYYEQIDDNRKAEHLYRVVKQQIDQFTGSKSIARIDDLLNKTFDGIMDKVLSSGLELKDKELLLLRFVLAGFSAKSIAAILDDTHVNITQRKKRLLDKIQNLSPETMKELRNALNIK